MALVEGVGDEVTALFGLLSALLVLLLAWVSTHTAERGDPGSAASPPAAPGQPEGRPGGQGAPPEGPGSPGADLRHRTGRRSPERPSPPTAGSGSEAFPADNTITLRLKFLNDTERLARVHPEDTVGALKRAHFPGQERLVRLIYQGRLLRDDAQTLAALHLAHRSVLHCHLPPPRAPAAAAPAAARPEAALHVGSLMVPLFALLLGALWLLRLQHRHAFTAAATACLAGLTLLFGLVAFAVYRR